MSKYILIILSLYTPLHCMQSLIEQETQNCFKNLTVLSYDGWQDHAILIAKNATLVHSNIKKTNNITNTVETPKKHPEIKNLFFREPQQNAYDLITVYNPYMLNKNNIVIHLKNIHGYLTPSGKFCFFIRTQNNNISVPEQAFATIYSQIYQSNHHTTTLQSNSCTNDQLKEIIWSNGYNIVFYQNKTYKTVIDNSSDYKETLKAAFINNIRHHNLPEKTVQQLTEQFITLIMQRNEKNSFGQLIESWNFTKITLCKTDKLRPPVFLNNSLLSTKWS